MEHSQLDLVRRPLSPDAMIEVPASGEEFEYRVQYDSVKGIAIVVASPTTLHSGIINELLHNICRSVRSQQGIDEDMKYRVYQETETDESTSGNAMTFRILNGAIRYKMNALDRLLMIAVEGGVSQSYSSLKNAISYAICHHPYGPLVSDGVIWFGQVNRVVLDVFRTENENYPEGTRLDPTRSFTIVRNGEFVGVGVPDNLVEVTIGDCIPTHLLIGQELKRPLFRAHILRTAIVRLKHKRAVQQ
ncbi:hypothetical protein V1524DRAFT_448909 [Lipomyces starkeyi]